MPTLSKQGTINRPTITSTPPGGVFEQVIDIKIDRDVSITYSSSSNGPPISKEITAGGLCYTEVVQPFIGQMTITVTDNIEYTATATFSQGVNAVAKWLHNIGGGAVVVGTGITLLGLAESASIIALPKGIPTLAIGAVTTALGAMGWVGGALMGSASSANVYTETRTQTVTASFNFQTITRTQIECIPGTTYLHSSGDPIDKESAETEIINNQLEMIYNS